MITYKTGDATSPRPNMIIVHVCNDVGGWGSGFVLALNEKFGTGVGSPRQQYWNWEADRENNDFALGAVQFVKVARNLKVANIIGQHLTGRDEDGNPCVRYEAIEAGLDKVGQEAAVWGASVHMPRIGCGLAGGTWDLIEPIIETTLCDNGIEVFVYDLPDQPATREDS